MVSVQFILLSVSGAVSADCAFFLTGHGFGISNCLQMARAVPSLFRDVAVRSKAFHLRDCARCCARIPRGKIRLRFAEGAFREQPASRLGQLYRLADRIRRKVPFREFALALQNELQGVQQVCFRFLESLTPWKLQPEPLPRSKCTRPPERAHRLLLASCGQFARNDSKAQRYRGPNAIAAQITNALPKPLGISYRLLLNYAQNNIRPPALYACRQRLRLRCRRSHPLRIDR